jgi:hypothetical protein
MAGKQFTIPTAYPIRITASPEEPVRLYNQAVTYFYAVELPCSEGTHDGEVAKETYHTFTTPTYLIAKTEPAPVQEVQSVGPTPRGGSTTAAAIPAFYTMAPTTAETGTSTAFAEKKVYLASLFLPVNKAINGISVQIGATGGTNKLIAALYNERGELLANSSQTTEGTVAGTAKESQALPLTAVYNAVGPALYYVGVTGNGNTATFYAIPANTSGAFTGESTLTTKNVLTSTVTVPTAFTASKGPIAWVY